VIFALPKNRLVYLLLACITVSTCPSSLLADNQTTAQRIIALSPSTVEQLYAIGAGDRIVGTVEYADYPEAAKKIPRVGNYAGIQIEQALALKPDLIVAWKGGNKQADLDKLKSLGVKVHQSQITSISQISHDLRKLGELTGLQQNAERVINDIAKKYRKISQTYATKKTVKVFYQLWHQPLRTIGPDSWIESLLKDCNAINLFSEANAPYPQVSFESVLVKNPQVIIIPHHSGNQGAKTEHWSKWPEIDAVKSQQIHVLNGDLLHRFTPRALDGLDTLCQRIDQARN
jgi:vitamin B12 transport system substrate-binding protein